MKQGLATIKKPPIFGGYDFTEEEEFSRMAMDITTVVQGFLRFSSGESYGVSDLQANELAAAGELLYWAQEYLAWHGLRGDKELNAAVRKWQEKKTVINGGLKKAKGRPGQTGRPL